MFKYIFLSVILLATPATAQNLKEVLCYKMQELAVAVAEARDSGVPKELMQRQVPASTDIAVSAIVYEMIEQAYGNGSELSPELFSLVAYESCQKSF